MRRLVAALPGAHAAMFVDEAIITVRSGAGGNGCLSFRRERFIPRGGPDGGNGGRGGSVYLVADENMATLLDVSRKSIHVAPNGRPGRGGNRTGRSGRDVLIHMPLGTVVREVSDDERPREGPLLGDLSTPGDRLLVAEGGRGGRGNTFFATPTRQVPRIAEEGKPGEERKLYLELKLLADVGLVGLPNAGKSTFLASVSAATPKIADYPFTTLEPHLGICEVGDVRRLVLADLPGLIEGAHEGVGLGIEFLRHIERTKTLVHLVSVESLDPDEITRSLRLVEDELAHYSRPLDAKPRLIVASKIDVLPAEERAPFLEALKARVGREVHGVSAVTGEGVRDVLLAAARLVENAERGEDEG